MLHQSLQSVKTILTTGTISFDRNNRAIPRNLITHIEKIFSRNKLTNNSQLEINKEFLQLNKVKIITNQPYLKFTANATSLLGVSSQDVTGIFFVHNNKLELLLRAELPNNWDFSWSYHKLPEYKTFNNTNEKSFFYKLRFNGRMKLIFSSYDFKISSTPQSYLNDLDSTLNVSKIQHGLNFVSRLNLSQFQSLPKVNNLLGLNSGLTTSNLESYGYLKELNTYEEIWLEIDFPYVGTFESIFAINVSKLALYSSTSSYTGNTKSGIALLGGITIGSGSRLSQNMGLFWPIGSDQLILRNTEPIPLLTLDTFNTLLGDKRPTSKNSFPINISSLGNIEIRELFLKFSKLSSTPSLDYIVFSVGPSQNWSYPLLGKALTIEDISLEWEVTTGAEKKVDFYILPTFNVGGGLVNASAVFPKVEFYGDLGLNQTIALDQVIKEIIPNAPLPNLSVLDLAVSADIKKSLYEFEIDIASDWELEAGKSLLKLKHLRLKLEKNNNGVFASINSVMTIGEIDIILLATNTNESTAGWTFIGNTRPAQEIPIGSLIKDLTRTFDIDNADIPKAIESLVIENIIIHFNTETRNFFFTCESTFEVDGTLVDFILKINIARQINGSYNKHFEGHINIGSSQFELIFDKDKTSKIFLASYDETTDSSIKIRDIIGSISSSLKSSIPAGLTINLKDALFAYQKKNSQSNFLLGLDIGDGINISNLPLLGKELSSKETIKLAYQILVTKANFLEAEITKINSLYPEGDISLPEKDISQRLSITTSMRLGQETKLLNLPITINQSTGQLEETNQPQNTPSSSGSVDSSDVIASNGTKWFRLQRNLGPLHFEKLGLKYQNKKIWFIIDGSITAAGLNLSLEGLSVSSPLNTLTPQFHLQGLGIDYEKGPVRIGGAFLKSQITVDSKRYDDYSGTAVISTKNLNLAAIGSYVKLDTGPSMFVYATLDYPIGGPSFFFITGLAAGFGYNRLLHIPSVDRVQTFPLVKQVIGGQGRTLNLAEELDELQKYIPPSVGNYFLAVGIRFTSFKMIDSFILVTATFGYSFELNIVGLSTVILPSPNGGRAGITPIAEIQIALRASFIPDEGFLGVNAQLTNNSFLLSHDCHLTGGFAFYSWFSGIHAGDFVLTVGGYHPHFVRPSHYPTVPRLGFNWQINSHLNIKGSAYYAITPSALMAGCSLSATYHKGNIKAWFDASMNFLISWKPYHYEAGFHIRIGASYLHIKVHVGADVTIWGPEFAGMAYVDITVISFTVYFGSSSRNSLQPISWSEFRNSFLPENDKICSINLKAGLVSRKAAKDNTSADKANSNHLGIINPKTLCLTTDSVIPIKHIYLTDQTTTELDSTGAIKNFDIGTMQITHSELVSTQNIIIKIDNKVLKRNEIEQNFDFQPIIKNVPAALWGNKLKPSLQGKQILPKRLTGYEIHAKRPDKALHTSPINYATLQKEVTLEDERDAFSWTTLNPFVAQNITDIQARQKINTTLKNESITTIRTDISNALFTNISLDLNNLNADQFLVTPQVN